jgi:hypothetical protein
VRGEFEAYRRLRYSRRKPAVRSALFLQTTVSSQANANKLQEIQIKTKLFHHSFTGLVAAALTMFIGAESSSQESNTSRPSIDIRVPKVAQALGVSRVMVQSRFLSRRATLGPYEAMLKLSRSIKIDWIRQSTVWK